MSYIEIYSGGGIEVHDRLPETVRTTALAIAKRFWVDSRLYDRDGVVWRPVAENPDMSGWQRVLASTVYNPLRTIRMRHERAGEYRLPELKTRIRECVDEDDDVLTQFMEAEAIKDALEKAAGFDDVVALLKRMQTE